MELGNFLGKLKGHEQEEPKQFLALILTDEVVQASVWSVVDQITQITSIGTPVEWDGDTGTTNELITAVDATIASATEGLTSEPNEVILGIPHIWTDKNGILGVKKELISKLSHELELRPIGYVVITDSILSYLKMQEGTPTTSILIQVSRAQLTLVLVRLGQIEAIENIGRGDDIVADVEEGISRFKLAENLPSRIVLFNSMHDLSEIIQSLLSVNWQTKFNFLHLPKIEALPKDIAIRALSVAGGSELAKSLGITLSPLPTPPLDQPEHKDPTPPPSDLLTPEEIGFTSASPKLDFIDPDDQPEENEPPLPPVAVPPTTRPKFTLPKFTLPRINLNLVGIKKHYLLWGGGILALILGIMALIYFIPHATFIVTVAPKTTDQDIELTLSTTASSIDFANQTVPAKIETLSESGELIKETTGKKIIGDPATGELTIYNRTTASKNFPKGTVLTAGSLKFSLDEEVQVASKSAGSDYVDVPGKATVKLTALAIGQDSNLSAGTEFTIASFGKDSYVGKNDNSLSGGTSQEVRVISQEDQGELVKELTAQLLTQLKDRVLSASNPGTGVYLIEDSAQVDEAIYSGKIGETAQSLKLNLTLTATLLHYATDDVLTLVNSAIDQAVPSGYVRADLPSQVELTAKNIEENAQTLEGTAKVKVTLIPTLDEPQLAKLIKGKTLTEIEQILAQAVPGYQSTVMEVTPKQIPPRLKVVPKNAFNIKFKIISASGT